MKRYIKSSRSEFPYVVVVDNNWNQFLNKIEKETGLYVDSAYKRRRKGDNWLELFDEYGNTFEAEITKYHNGDYEFRAENMHLV